VAKLTALVRSVCLSVRADLHKLDVPSGFIAAMHQA
jgi:hypothetical protein